MLESQLKRSPDVLSFDFTSMGPGSLLWKNPKDLNYQHYEVRGILVAVNTTDEPDKKSFLHVKVSLSSSVVCFLSSIGTTSIFFAGLRDIPMIAKSSYAHSQKVQAKQANCCEDCFSSSC